MDESDFIEAPTLPPQDEIEALVDSVFEQDEVEILLNDLPISL